MSSSPLTGWRNTDALSSDTVSERMAKRPRLAREEEDEDKAEKRERRRFHFGGALTKPNLPPPPPPPSARASARPMAPMRQAEKRDEKQPVRIKQEPS